jgi:hypothetical protein
MSFLPELEMLAYYHAFDAAVPGRLRISRIVTTYSASS